MKRLIASHALLLFTGCYGVENEAPVETAPNHAPALASPKLVGTTAVRVPGNASDAGVADVEACLWGDQGGVCTSSAGDGAYALGPLGPSQRYRVHYAKAGLVPTIAEYDVPEHSIAADVFLFSENTLAQSANANALGAIHDLESTGAVVLSVHTITYEGIVPLEGARAGTLGDAEFTYAGTANELDPTLRTTTRAGWVLALGLQPGSHRLEVSHIDQTARCGRFTVHTGSFEDSVVIDVVPGTVTLAKAYCFR